MTAVKSDRYLNKAKRKISLKKEGERFQSKNEQSGKLLAVYEMGASCCRGTIL